MRIDNNGGLAIARRKASVALPNCLRINNVNALGNMGRKINVCKGTIFFLYLHLNLRNMFPIEDLNKSQQEAVLYNDGPCLVIAGAGSGKTRVLTYKIAYLLSLGIPATSIVALTFTNKAAREMKKRIENLVGAGVARYLWMGTFHSICARILRKEVECLGFTSDFTIYDAADSKNLIKRIIKEMALDDKAYRVNNVAARISMAKNHLLTDRDYARNVEYIKEDEKARMPLLYNIFSRYNKQLRNDNAMDFDDLLFYMNVLLHDFPSVREKYQQNFGYVFVDEYQDTNYAQDLIVRVLTEPQRHICVVGDDAQSIYSFRGADIAHILRFQQQFPDARLFKLEQNYRSTQNIVGAANSLIKKNYRQIPKEVFSEKEKGDLVHISRYADDREEAMAIANMLSKRNSQKKEPYNQFAVLYRTNAQSRVLEDAFRKKNIPYKIYGSMSFYQRKEVKDALAYMYLAVNPENTEALLRIINVPSRGIGDTTIKKLTDIARTQGMSLNTLLRTLPNNAVNIASSTCQKLLSFVSLLDSFAAKAQTATAYEFADDVLKRSQLLLSAVEDRTVEGQERKANLEELLAGIREQENDRIEQNEPPLSISEFLSDVALLTDQDEKTKDDTPRTLMMTVHAAKGLEFPVVFIVGMEEKLFPSIFAKDENNIEEERRLFYVAITRAEKECYISHVGQRFWNGAVQISNPSRFLQDIDTNFIDNNSCKIQVPCIERSGFFPEPKKSVYSVLRNLTKLPSKSPAAPKPVQCPYSVGTRIFHDNFGIGTVLETEEDRIKVQFDEFGTKTIFLAYAKLKKV